VKAEADRAPPPKLITHNKESETSHPLYIFNPLDPFLTVSSSSHQSVTLLMAVRYTKEDLRKACAETVKSNNIQASVKMWTVPFSPIQVRLNGVLLQSVAHQKCQ